MSNEHRAGIQGAGWLNIVLGAAVLLTPFFTGETTQAPLWNALVAGAVVGLLAAYNVYAATKRHTERATGPAVVNIVLGLWVLASGFVLAASMAYTTAMAVFGAAIVIAAVYNSWAANDARRHATPM